MCGDICDRITWRMKVDPTFFVDRIWCDRGIVSQSKTVRSSMVDCHVRPIQGQGDCIPREAAAMVRVWLGGAGSWSSNTYISCGGNGLLLTPRLAHPSRR